MPIALYEHACFVTKATTKHHERWVCKKCGQQAQFAGWSFGMVGSWGHYSSRYGLRPIGPHRHLANRLLGEIPTGACEPCAGRGAQHPDRDETTPGRVRPATGLGELQSPAVRSPVCRSQWRLNRPDISLSRQPRRTQ